MKTILFSMLFLVVLVASASTFPEEHPEHLGNPEWIKSDIKLQKSSESFLFKICTVTSSGFLLIDGNKVSVTATVDGPCDASLATRLRACIAKLRASVK